VVCDGVDTFLATTFVSSARLTAIVPAALLANSTTAEVFVQTGDPMGDGPFLNSSSVRFPVTASAPGATQISSISPASAVAGSPDLVVTIIGSNFDGTGAVQSRAIWVVNGSTLPLSTTFVSSTLLTALIPAAFLTGPAEAQVAVEHYDTIEQVPDGMSNSVGFSISSSVSGSGVGLSSGFAPVGNMSAARVAHTATLLTTGKVLIAGGGTATADLFDPSTLSFSATGSMNTLRSGATATLLVNGKVLIVGGFGSGTSQLPRLNSAELYDPLTGTFSATGNMSVGRVLHTAVLLNDGRVLVAGGTTSPGGGGAATASAEIYDPATGLFTRVGNMVSERAQPIATLLANGRVLVTGGWNGHRADAADDPPWDPLFAELFDPGSASFEAAARMSTTRIGHAAIPLPSGAVLVIGGIPQLQNLNEPPLNPQYAELYDPKMQTFSSIGSMQIVQQNFTATLLTNGKVLIAGGDQSGNAVSSAELLDPATGKVIATGGLIEERTGHSATLLPDGSVLVVGGVDVNGNALAAAERYK
jgi:hypothetical protein